MKHYKFIHILWGQDVKFSGPLINMFIESPEVFDHTEHLFVTPYETVKRELPDIDNVILDPVGSKADIINRYAETCDWLISHDMVDVCNCLRVKRKYFKKIVWRTWGGSRQRTNWNVSKPIKSIFGKLVDVLYYSYMRYTFGTSPVIGIANSVDIVDLEQWNWHKKSKLLLMGYSDSSYDTMLSNVRLEQKAANSPIKFLVGHQGDPGEHHLELTKKILSFNQKNILVIIPLSYGNKNYIGNLKNQLDELNDERIIILNNLLPINEYLQLLADIDIAVIDEKTSMALGNIAFLLGFKKKIFLNKDSVIKKAFDHENLPYSLTAEIGNMSFDELVRPLPYPKETSSDLVFHPYPFRVKRYATLFSYLDKLGSNG